MLTIGQQALATPLATINFAGPARALSSFREYSGREGDDQRLDADSQGDQQFDADIRDRRRAGRRRLHDQRRRLWAAASSRSSRSGHCGAACRSGRRWTTGIICSARSLRSNPRARECSPSSTVTQRIFSRPDSNAVNLHVQPFDAFLLPQNERGNRVSTSSPLSLQLPFKYTATLANVSATNVEGIGFYETQGATNTINQVVVTGGQALPSSPSARQTAVETGLTGAIENIPHRRSTSRAFLSQVTMSPGISTTASARPIRPISRPSTPPGRRWVRSVAIEKSTGVTGLTSAPAWFFSRRRRGGSICTSYGATQRRGAIPRLQQQRHPGGVRQLVLHSGSQPLSSGCHQPDHAGR